MNAVGKIATLFDNDISRQIEEVIKVDQRKSKPFRISARSYGAHTSIKGQASCSLIVSLGHRQDFRNGSNRVAPTCHP
jgi:hypothetical protein